MLYMVTRLTHPCVVVGSYRPHSETETHSHQFHPGVSDGSPECEIDSDFWRVAPGCEIGIGPEAVSLVALGVGCGADCFLLVFMSMFPVLPSLSLARGCGRGPHLSFFFV